MADFLEAAQSALERERWQLRGLALDDPRADLITIDLRNPMLGEQLADELRRIDRRNQLIAELHADTDRRRWAERLRQVADRRPLRPRRGWGA
jgi:hypothetical protein